MKRLMFSLLFSACAVSAWGKVFQMDSRGDAAVEVDRVGGEYRVICTFSPQTKFDSARNAKFNDAKGDSLCKKGLARYLDAGAKDRFSISGLHVAAPVEKVGGKLRYSFAVPVSGCGVEAAGQPKVVAKTETVSAPQVAVKPVERSVPKVKNTAPQAEKSTVAVAVPTETPAKAAKVVRSASYMSVVKYKEVNGHRSMVSQREYRGSDFRSRQEFDQFCASEFARIRALGERNLRAVRNLGK